MSQIRQGEDYCMCNQRGKKTLYHPYFDHPKQMRKLCYPFKSITNMLINQRKEEEKIRHGKDQTSVPYN
jgi:hypothetical protein